MKQKKVLGKSVFVAVYVAVAVACVLLDQLTKLWIFDGLLQGQVGKSVDVLGKFLRFTALYNEGAAFGIGQEESSNIVFFVITLVGIPLFGWLLWRSRTRSVWGQIGFAFIVGGTIGNAIDRTFIQSTEGQFFSGKVRDFISFSIFPPIFNVADSFLVIGVIMAILAIVFFDSDGLVAVYRQEKAQKSAGGSGSAEQSAEQIEDTNAANGQQDALPTSETENNDEKN